MRRNRETDDMWPSMRRQMAVMWQLCEKYPSMDFYRMCGSRKTGCRITVMGSDVAEVWTEELSRNKSIGRDFAGSVISNYVTDEDKAKAVAVNKRDYSAMGEAVFGRFAYQSTWSYKWIRFAATYDELYEIIEHVIKTYAKETGEDLSIKREEYEKDYYRSSIQPDIIIYKRNKDESVPAHIRQESNTVGILSIKVAVMTFCLHAPWVHSLKEKCMIVKSLTARLQNRFHVSAAEVDEQDTHQIIVIGIAAIVPNNAIADSLMEEISLFVENNTEAVIIDEEREIR